jgi:hypothetical protein
MRIDRIAFLAAALPLVACASSSDGTGSSTNDLSAGPPPAASAGPPPVGFTKVCTQDILASACRDAEGVRSNSVCTKTEVRRLEFVVADGHVTGVRYSFAGGIDLYAEPPEDGVLLTRVVHPVKPVPNDAAFRGMSDKTKNIYAVDMTDFGGTEAAIPSGSLGLRVISPSGDVENPLFADGECQQE